MARILVIDDEESIRFAFKTHLMDESYEVMTAADYSSGMEAVTRFYPDLVITDIILGGHTGIDILRNIKDMGMRCQVVLITGEPNLETAADGVILGAFDYLPKPIRKETLLRVTSHALRHKALMDEKNKAETDNIRYRLTQDAIFNSLRDAIVIVDNHMQVLEVNNKFKTVCGFSSDRIVGKDIMEITALCNKSCISVLKEILKTKHPIKDSRCECIHLTDPNRKVLLTGLPLTDHKDDILGAILVIRDITHLSVLEGELAERDPNFS